jgi:signal peptidase I
MKRKALTGFGLSLVMILLITLFFYFNFKTVIVSGRSMEPTFKDKQRLLACRAYWLVGGIKDKDVVVIKHGPGPQDYIIKRVYKMAGEVVDWVNVPASWKLTNGEYKVPEGHIYVLGDNREVSEDSRKFDAVPIDQVIGKIVKR